MDKDIIDTVKTCNFARKCLEDFDNALCCDIIKECSTFLVVKPTSSFKSSNCTHCHSINYEGADVHICSCPTRLMIFHQQGL